MAKRSIPQDLLKSAISLYESGRSIPDIGLILGRHKSTVRYWLFISGVKMDKIARLSAKMKGRPSHRKGATHSEESKLLMSRSSHHLKTTLGKIYSPEERQHISDGLRAYYASIPKMDRPSAKITTRVLLSAEERLRRSRCRSRYKNLVRRLIKNKARRRTEEFLGYSQAEFRKHIESQFTEAMSWSNRESFHIDHKIPVVAFLKAGITDPRIVNALGNLQPLTREQNQRKGGKVAYTAELGEPETRTA